MAMNPQDLLRRRFGGAFMPGGVAGMVQGPTMAPRVGAMGMYIPAPMGGGGSTAGVRMNVEQGAWGQPAPEQISRAVGTAGLGEPSVVPTMNPAGTGEAAWRQPTGAVIPESTIEQAAQSAGIPMGPAPFVQGAQGSEEVRAVMGSGPVEPPQSPASVGSPTPPTGIIGAAQGTGSTTTMPPPTPPAAPFQPAAPQAAPPPPAPITQSAAPIAQQLKNTPMQIGSGENRHLGSAYDAAQNAYRRATSGPARERPSNPFGGILGRVLSGFGRRGGILGFLSNILGGSNDYGGGR